MREGGREEGMRGRGEAQKVGERVEEGERQREKRHKETKIEKRDDGGREGGRGKGRGLRRDKTAHGWVRGACRPAHQTNLGVLVSRLPFSTHCSPALGDP